MRCALVSSSLDLRGYLGAQFARIADRIEIVDHRRNGSVADIRLAVAWHPPDDAFERYPNLQAVCSIGAGVDNIIACPSLRPGIEVVRIVDPQQAQMMSGFVIWHVIWHQRRFRTYLDQQRDGNLAASPSAQRAGRTGRHFGLWRNRPACGRRSGAARFPGHGVEPDSEADACLRQGFHGPSGLAAMLGETEVLVNLLPLTQETQGILNGELFARMRRGGFLIQVGRGEHLVDHDLLAALESGQLEGAALDVFAAEPLAPEHPFWRHPKIVITPHDASEVRLEAVAATLVATADAIRTGQRPPYAIDRQRGY